MIVGKKVRLRRPPDRGWEHELLVAWRNDPANKRFFIREEPISLDSHLAWWDVVRQDHHQRFYLVESLIDPDGPVLIGTTSLFDIDWASRTANYGRLLINGPDRQKGYGFEAEVLLLSYAFNVLGLRKIWSEILAYNEAALRLHEKTGFVVEGRLRWHVLKDGKYIDLVLIGLMKDEFEAQIENWWAELGVRC